MSYLAAHTVEFLAATCDQPRWKAAGHRSGSLP
jgi:hypothetical protein